jgi:hypothetical protein
LFITFLNASKYNSAILMSSILYQTGNLSEFLWKCSALGKSPWDTALKPQAHPDPLAGLPPKFPSAS